MSASQTAKPTTHPGRKPVIGLAGGIGSGKSLVAGQLAARGCGVIDADQLARQALDEPTVRRQVVEWWGPQMIDEDGRIRRQALAEVVFSDPSQLRRLESVTHPHVHAARALLREDMQHDPTIAAIVEDCPLLFEKGLDRSCDKIIVVQASRANRLARVAQSRGWSARELDRREANQLPFDAKLQRADYVVDNNADAAYCDKQVARILSEIFQHQKFEIQDGSRPCDAVVHPEPVDSNPSPAMNHPRSPR